MSVLKMLFKCPQCGGKNFETQSQPEAFEDYEGAICRTCNHCVSSKEVSNEISHMSKRKITKFDSKGYEQSNAFNEFY